MLAEKTPTKRGESSKFILIHFNTDISRDLYITRWIETHFELSLLVRLDAATTTQHSKVLYEASSLTRPVH